MSFSKFISTIPNHIMFASLLAEASTVNDQQEAYLNGCKLWIFMDRAKKLFYAISICVFRFHSKFYFIPLVSAYILTSYCGECVSLSSSTFNGTVNKSYVNIKNFIQKIKTVLFEHFIKYYD